MTRTRDLLITSEMHYQLCYTSIFSPIIISAIGLNVNSFFLHLCTQFPDFLPDRQKIIKGFRAFGSIPQQR